MKRRYINVNNKEKKSILQIIVNIIVDILMLASILLFALALYTGYKNQDCPNESFLLGYKPVYVMTGSMEPTLKVNGIAIVQKTEYDSIQLDDIIMYEIDDKMITHRVIDISEEGIRTKGDNNQTQDAYILTEENIKGKVVYIMNWTADLIQLLKTSNGRIRVILICVIIICSISTIIGIKCFISAKKKERLLKVNDKALSAKNKDEVSKTSYIKLIFQEDNFYEKEDK